MSDERLQQGPAMPDGRGNGRAGMGGARRARQLTTLEKTLVFGGAGAAFVGVVAACAAAENGGAAGGSTTDPQPIDTPTAPVIPSPAPNPDGCGIPVNHVDTCVVNSETLKVPMIDGVVARIVSGKVEFFATDTRYGVESGTYVGQYVPGVTENGQTTGALGYTQPVLEKLMAGLPTNTIVLNADISGLGNVDISVDPNSAAAAGTGLITIDTHGRSVAMYDIVPGTRQYMVSSTVWGGDNEQLLSRYVTQNGHYNAIVPGHEADYIMMYGPYGLPHTTLGSNNYPTLSFGQSLGMSHGEPTRISYGVNKGDGANIQSQILNVNGTPVFITAPAA